MNWTINSTAILLSALMLSACGSSSSDNQGSEEEHEHSMLISQQNTISLSFLEEGEAESLADAAANAATLLLSNTGEQAAIITAGSVAFLVSHDDEADHEGEEHEVPQLSDFTLTGTRVKVVNTVGHFSVLADGHTSFVPFNEPAAETLSLGVETHPALLLEEGETESLTLVFNGTNAVVYEGETAQDTKACVTVDSVAHAGEFAVISCDGSSFSVKVEEGETDHTIVMADIAGINESVEWSTRAGVFVGLGDNTFYVVEENDAEALILEGSFAEPSGMCTWGIDSLHADIFSLTTHELNVLNHEGDTQSTLTLDETQNATCDDLTMTTANQAVFVMDNSGTVLYEIDKEEGSAAYHIHGRETLSINDVADAVVFHEVGSESHDHEH